MAIEEGRSFAGVCAEPRTAEEARLERLMDFCLAAQARMEELGLSRRELAERMGKPLGRVERELSGRAGLAPAAMAEYAAALGMGPGGGFSAPIKRPGTARF